MLICAEYELPVLAEGEEDAKAMRAAAARAMKGRGSGGAQRGGRGRRGSPYGKTGYGGGYGGYGGGYGGGYYGGYNNNKPSAGALGPIIGVGLAGLAGLAGFGAVNPTTTVTLT